MLRVLLLVCAGALLVIIVTMMSEVFDARSGQTASATYDPERICKMQARLSVYLPSLCEAQQASEIQ